MTRRRKDNARSGANRPGAQDTTHHRNFKPQYITGNNAAKIPGALAEALKAWTLLNGFAPKIDEADERGEREVKP